ncbi:hypothetical protein AB0E08_46585, partial [Streptomyces sp. NPDC048281]|uniref:hypothetical protein n=1 Tax=Streptomyces sp. NPDC048281 TaxID=3154715 RepID=UPI003425F609
MPKRIFTTEEVREVLAWAAANPEKRAPKIAEHFGRFAENTINIWIRGDSDTSKQAYKLLTQDQLESLQVRRVNWAGEELNRRQRDASGSGQATQGTQSQYGEPGRKSTRAQRTNQEIRMILMEFAYSDQNILNFSEKRGVNDSTLRIWLKGKGAGANVLPELDVETLTRLERRYGKNYPNLGELLAGKREGAAGLGSVAGGVGVSQSGPDRSGAVHVPQ